MQFYCQDHILWFTEDQGHAVQTKDSLIPYVNKVSTANFMAPHRFMIIIRMWDGHHQDQDEDKIEMELQQLSRESLANLMTTPKVLAQTDTKGGNI